MHDLFVKAKQIVKAFFAMWDLHLAEQIGVVAADDELFVAAL